VRRFYEAVAGAGADGVAQAKWYDEGVGAHWYDRFIGGAIGAGLDQNIRQGYRFLANTYQDGDEVYILGFSRGAYTARSLVGLIRNCGLLKRNRLNAVNIGVAYGIYRTRDDGPDSWTARTFRQMFSREIRIKFLGVWDTVGALGLPLDIMRNFNLKFYEFHDTNLSRIVDNAYHAIAVDEHRKDYDVCLWTPSAAPQQTLEQRWFLGAHSNVGGGYADRRLSDITLQWMRDKANALGLGLAAIHVAPTNYQAPIVDSYAEFMSGNYAKLNPRYFRSIGKTQFGNEVIDPTVKQRQRDVAEYQPSNPGL
jgi:uncharacterized protein (DUF2235 family)